MKELTVIGIEGNTLLANSETGERFTIVIDELLKSQLREKKSPQTASQTLTPKEIQSYIRSGMSATEVTHLTGADLDYVRRFEGAIVAEREHVVTNARAVPVQLRAEESGSPEETTFGLVIDERLHTLSAQNILWTSWKDSGGMWVIKLTFTAKELEHDARWNYEPKKTLLQPLNQEATTLSTDGSFSGELIPKLRVVDKESQSIDQSRFDSGAFHFPQNQAYENTRESHTPFSRSTYGLNTPKIPQPGHSKSLPNDHNVSSDPSGKNETADLLEALRKRRGERENQNKTRAELPLNESPQKSKTEIVVPEFSKASTKNPEAPLSQKPHKETITRVAQNDSEHAQTVKNQKHAQVKTTVTHSTQRPPKKGRAMLPSWDEIVFGARPDDDSA